VRFDGRGNTKYQRQYIFDRYPIESAPDKGRIKAFRDEVLKTLVIEENLKANDLFHYFIEYKADNTNAESYTVGQ